MADGGFAMVTVTAEFGAGYLDVLVLRLAPDGTVSPTCPPSIGSPLTPRASGAKLKPSTFSFNQGSVTPTIADYTRTHPDISLTANLICKF
jgi:hypothetical protein